MATRVLVVDDHAIVRDGVAALLAKEPDLEVVGQAGSGRNALDLARELSPDVIVMDVAMRDLDGAEATRQIVAAVPAAKVIALSVHAGRSFVSRMLAAGAAGYVLKECAVEELLQAIRTVAEGGTYLGRHIAPLVVDDFVHGVKDAAPPSAADGLTPREREVLQLITEGCSTKEAAYKLRVSVKTVETHRRNIMGKLQIHNVAELTKFAIREGITTLST